MQFVIWRKPQDYASLRSNWHCNKWALFFLRGLTIGWAHTVKPFSLLDQQHTFFSWVSFLLASGACWFPEKQTNIASHNGTELLSRSNCQTCIITSDSEWIRKISILKRVFSSAQLRHIFMKYRWFSIFQRWKVVFSLISCTGIHSCLLVQLLIGLFR